MQSASPTGITPTDLSTESGVLLIHPESRRKISLDIFHLVANDVRWIIILTLKMYASWLPYNDYIDLFMYEQYLFWGRVI